LLVFFVGLAPLAVASPAVAAIPGGESWLRQQLLTPQQLLWFG
jgi:hypothetical protein